MNSSKGHLLTAETDENLKATDQLTTMPSKKLYM